MMMVIAMTKIQRNKQTIIHLLEEMSNQLYKMRMIASLLNRGNPSAEVHLQEEYTILTEAFMQLSDSIEPEVTSIQIVESGGTVNDNEFTK